MILVVAFPRTRSTMTMRILDALGAVVIRHPGDPNWEHSGTAEGVNTSGVPANRAIKLMLPAFFRSQIQPTDRVIFCLRRPESVRRSVIRVDAGIRNPRFNYWRLLKEFKAWKDATANPVLVVDTDALLSNRIAGVAAIANFLGVAPNAAARNLVEDGATETEVFPEPEDDAKVIYEALKP